MVEGEASGGEPSITAARFVAKHVARAFEPNSTRHGQLSATAASSGDMLNCVSPMVAWRLSIGSRSSSRLHGWFGAGLNSVSSYTVPVWSTPSSRLNNGNVGFSSVKGLDRGVAD